MLLVYVAVEGAESMVRLHTVAQPIYPGQLNDALNITSRRATDDTRLWGVGSAALAVPLYSESDIGYILTHVTDPQSIKGTLAPSFKDPRPILVISTAGQNLVL